MNITLVYDSGKEENRRLFGEAERWCRESGHHLNTFDAGVDPLEPCIGCFGCWIKTPGICVHRKDRGEEYLKAILASDYYLRITEILWGGYETSIKNYTDRILPLLHPDFQRLQGEMHHKLRYKKYPPMLIAGWGAKNPEEEATFLKIYKANLLNYHENGPELPLLLSSVQEGKMTEWLTREIADAGRVQEAGV